MRGKEGLMGCLGRESNPGPSKSSMLALPLSHTMALVLQPKDILLSASRAISRVLVLQSQDLLLPALLNNEVFFALVLEKFLVGIFCVINCF